MLASLIRCSRAVALVPCLLVSGVAFAQTATTGTINFTGTITAVPCEIDTSATDSAVSMAKVFANDFTGVGTTTGTTNFQIALKNCGDATSGATVTFSGTADSANTKALKTTGDATGVALQLIDDTGTPVDVGTASKTYAIAKGANTFSFAARYIATADTVAGGQANSQALFSLTYK
jgi:major type 1 subunit fimbrin (pilin)